MATVTCQTQGCVKQGEAVPDVGLTYTDEEGQTCPVDSVVCGACGQEVTEITDDEREALT